MFSNDSYISYIYATSPNAECIDAAARSFANSIDKQEYFNVLDVLEIYHMEGQVDAVHSYLQNLVVQDYRNSGYELYKEIKDFLTETYK